MADIFDRIKLDLFDEVELTIEDQIIYSKEMSDLIREELRKEIGKLPLGKIISSVIQGEIEKQSKSMSLNKSALSGEIDKTKNSIKRDVVSMKSEIDEMIGKLRDKYDNLKSDILNKPAYQFGGFAPPSPTGNSGKFLTTDGTYAGISWGSAGSSNANPVNIGDPTINGSWRLYDDGTNLTVQRLESGVWTEKGMFLS